MNEEGEGKALSNALHSSEERFRHYDPKIIPLSLRDIIAHFHYKEKETNARAQGGKKSSRTVVIDKRVRRLSVKENDFAYQQKRILHFKRLIRAYPESRSRITQVNIISLF